MFSDDDLHAMDAAERAELLRRLVASTGQASLVEGRTQRERYVAITAVAAAFLVGWVVYLAATLPRTYTTGHWRLTWVGFDCALAFVLAATALLALWRRQLVIVTSVMAGTLLICDAWFDTTTAAGRDRWLSWVSVPLETILAIVLLGTGGVFLHHLGSTASAAPSSTGSRLRPLLGMEVGGLRSTIRSLRGRPTEPSKAP
ncbi:hypothetical protein M6D93_04650 [Jatrophihabitans telluris]|uniref:Uncharacterized protein n=1 Tax=Jatrophihabitans telluris TaxID=2038343 RepID=A0ABY4R2B0_9ACTN|nr:hypothetical protein [Jatrophihabitans telluris]UQX89296.1 hypothetical protein M6D93_04650 [Jatrophihabitans telluris]